MRSFPKTIKWFKNQTSFVGGGGGYELVEMFKYHGLGPYTEPNDNALFLGTDYYRHVSSNSNSNSNPNEQEKKGIQPIWNYFQENGYLVSRIDKRATIINVMLNFQILYPLPPL